MLPYGVCVGEAPGGATLSLGGAISSTNGAASAASRSGGGAAIGGGSSFAPHTPSFGGGGGRLEGEMGGDGRRRGVACRGPGNLCGRAGVTFLPA